MATDRAKRGLAAAAVAVGCVGSARAQPRRDAVSDYLRRGAEVTSVPTGDQAGAAYFSQGASATSVPQEGEPGAAYFSRGADVTSVPTGDEAGAEYFSDGADATGVPPRGEPGASYFREGAAATRAPTGDEPGAQYFSRGAEATSVPTGDEPGAEYFSDGAGVTTVGPHGQFRWWHANRVPPHEPAEGESAEPEVQPTPRSAEEETTGAPPAGGVAAPSPSAPVDGQGDSVAPTQEPAAGNDPAAPAPARPVFVEERAVRGSPPDAGPSAPAIPAARPDGLQPPWAEAEPVAPEGWFESLVQRLRRSARAFYALVSLSLLVLAFALWVFVARWRRRRADERARSDASDAM